MGKHKFKLSNLMPNSWFYKLKDMSKSNKNPNSFIPKRNYNNNQGISTTPKPIPSQSYLPNRASYYLSTHERSYKFPIKINPKTIDIHFPIDSPKKVNQNLIKKPVKTLPYERDIYTEEDLLEKFLNFEVKLRPIKTKGLKTEDFDDQPRSPGIRRSRRLQVYKTRNPLLRGFAVVKTSLDPKRDFRESMIDMIIENGIQKTEDLEELLICYLKLNSIEYHKMIVKVFEQILIELDC